VFPAIAILPPTDDAPLASARMHRSASYDAASDRVGQRGRIRRPG
jgi:hypothetical protein